VNVILTLILCFSFWLVFSCLLFTSFLPPAIEQFHEEPAKPEAATATATPTPTATKEPEPEPEPEPTPVKVRWFCLFVRCLFVWLFVVFVFVLV
jgi:hypothetical protein